MSAASPAPSPSPASSADLSSSGIGRAIDLTSRLATSWIGQLTTYVAALTASVVAFQQLQTHLKDWPLWTRIALVAALPVAVFVLHTIPALIEQYRKKRLTEITGDLRSGYFRLVPREDQASFTRADGKHEEVLEWLERPPSPLLYLTGQSGSGKSSLLAAWVIPHLVRQGARVVRLRGYQDPLAALEKELQKPGVIWQKSSEAGDLRSLLERACRYLRPNCLLVVLDQFEEFVILQDPEQQQRFEQFVASLRQAPIADLIFLFVFRSDYIGLVEKLSLPPLAQDTNWKEVPPFTERAAREFMEGGVQVSDNLLRDVLREASEIEQTKGLVRPVTINLCGLVLSRFAHGLPRAFRHRGLIRAFLQESILLPSVRDVAPRLVPHLITNYVTKQPRTVAELAKSTGLDPAAVRGCLLVLGQRERAIVRPLDADQQTWEVSHDFLVPLLDSIVARWTVSLWRKGRPWLPWIGTAVMVVAAVGASNWRKDPRVELNELGWGVKERDNRVYLTFDSGVPPTASLSALRRLHGKLEVKLEAIDESISEWNDLSNLSTLDLSFTKVSDLKPLRGLTSLSTLDLRGTEVSDLEPLKGLTNLSTLNLDGTHVSDLELLRGLTKLSSLDLTGYAGSSLEPLRGMTKLSSLDLLAATKVSNLEPLKGLTNLSSLDLGETRASNLEPLRGMTKLSKLDLYSMPVSNLEPLKGLTDLSTLNLTGTRASNLEPLRGMTKLSKLDLYSTPVSNLEPLKRLPNLTDLELGGTEVSNLEPLRGLTKLSKLNLSGTKVSNLEPLKSLPNLTELELGGTPRLKVSEDAVRDLQNANPKLKISR